MKLEEKILAYLQEELSPKVRQAFEEEIKQDSSLQAKVKELHAALSMLPINEYLDGLLSKKEVQAFEAKLTENALLKKAIQQRERIHALMNIVAWKDTPLEVKETARNQLRKLLNQGAKKQRIRKLFLYSLAAGLLFIVIGGLLLQLWPTSLDNPSLSEQFFEAYPANDFFRSEQDTSQMSFYEKALWLYSLSYYAQAARQLMVIRSSDSTYAAAQFFLGNAYLANQSPSAAIPVFQDLLNYPSSPTLPTARTQWYLSLAYLANDEASPARELLEILSKNEEDKSYRSKAYELLKEMR